VKTTSPYPRLLSGTRWFANRTAGGLRGAGSEEPFVRFPASPFVRRGAGAERCDRGGCVGV